MSKALTSLKYTLTLRSGVAATIQTLLINILILGINVGTGMITARLLGPDGRGLQAAIAMWPQFLATLLALGLPSALLYNIKLHPEESDALVGAALVIGVTMGLVAVLCGVLLIPRWLDQYPVVAIRFTQFAMLLAPLNLMGMVFSSAMRARDAFTLYNRTRYLPPLLTLIALVVLALTHHLNPFTAALAYLLNGLPVTFWIMSWVWREYRPTLRTFATARRHLLSYSLRSWGVGLFGTLALYTDRVLVVGFVAPAVMGLYVVALSLSDVLRVFPSAVVQVLFPKASGQPKDRVVALTGHAVRISTAATTLAAAGLVLVGPQLLGLLYGKDFTAATTVFRLLAVVVVLNGATQILMQAFMALDRPGLGTLLQGVGVGVSVPLLMWLVPRYGLEGAGVALLLSALVRLLFICLSFPLALRVGPPRLWMWPGEVPGTVKGGLSWLRK